MSAEFPYGLTGASSVGFGESNVTPNDGNNNRIITLVALACIALVAALICLEMKYSALSAILLLVKMNPIISFVCTLCAIGAGVYLIIYFTRLNVGTSTYQIDELRDEPLDDEIQDRVEITDNNRDAACLMWYEVEYPDDIERQKQKYRQSNVSDRSEYLRCSATYIEFLTELHNQAVQRPPAVNRNEDVGAYQEYERKLEVLQTRIAAVTLNNQLLVAYANNQA